MIALLTYLLKANLLLLIALAIYLLVLRSTSFHQWKRAYLLFALLFSCISPLFIWTTYEEVIVNNTQTFNTKITNATIPQNNTLATYDWSHFALQIVLLLYTITAVSLSFKWIIRYRQFRKFNQLATPTNFDKNVLHHPQIDIAYSTFQNIYINANNIQPHDIKTIIKHEQWHIKEYHLLDSYLLQWIKILFWFNPILKRYAREISLNQECIVDGYMSDNNDIASYQLKLLQYQTHIQQSGMANQFAFSNLKQRIIFMNQKKSPKWQLSFIAAATILIGSSGILLAHQKKEIHISAKEELNTLTESQPNILTKEAQQEKITNPGTKKNSTSESNKVINTPPNPIDTNEINKVVLKLTEEQFRKFTTSENEELKIETRDSQIVIINKINNTEKVIGRIDSTGTMYFGDGWEKVN